VGHVARMAEERKVYRVLVKNPEGKRPLGRPRRGWSLGSEWMLGRLAWGGGGVDPVGSGYGPVAGSCKCGDEAEGSGATELILVSYMQIFSLVLCSETPSFYRPICPLRLET
jgi:hypothetical protein